jgi:hypothetical protein
MMEDTGAQQPEGALLEDPKAGVREPAILTLVALALGVAFEVLFYDHPLGVSFPLWVLLSALALLASARLERREFARASLVLLAPLLFFALMVFFRFEPFTVFLNIVFTLVLLALWVRAFRQDQLGAYGWLDLLLALVWVPVEAWIRPWPILAEAQRRVFRGEGRGQVALAVVRGLLLALPVLAIFLALLTGADLVFADRVEAALRWLDMERLRDLAGRAMVILFSALFFLGALAVALRDPAERGVYGREEPFLKPFLGLIEALVVLGAVDLLFAFFVGVQFRYVFGGEANISAAGYTYSEYARRGFGELVAVGVLSLGLITLLGWFTRREARGSRRWFNALSALLVAEVGVILTSGLTRLLLYENAYGFTRLRTYTHLFIPWMGALLVAFLALLILGQLRRFALVVALGASGFVATLDLINVDGFIVRRNTARLATSGEIDVGYLTRLSEDAVPALARFAAQAPQEVRAELLPALACWERHLAREAQTLSWPSTHLSRWTAGQALASIAPLLEGYEVYRDEGGIWRARGGGGESTCPYGTWGSGLD